MFRSPSASPPNFYFWALFLSALLLLAGGLGFGFFLRGWEAWAVVAVYIGFDAWLLASTYLAARRAVMEERGKTSPPADPPPTPVSLAVVLCARNERVVLPLALEALRKALRDMEEIGGAEVVVVDDGSTDGTGEWMREAFLMQALDATASGGSSFVSESWPGLRLLALPQGGKARALNAGWRSTAGEVVVTLDADTLVEPGAIRVLRAAFTADPGLAVSGGVLAPRCAPGSGGLGAVFQFFQTFEYLRSFLWRAAWRRKGCLVLVSGAFSAYRREALEAVGGFDPGSLVEDYDIVYRIHRHGAAQVGEWKVGLEGGARATTDVPSRVLPFLRQRRRWFGGFLQVLFRNRDMAGRRRYGAVGTYMVPLKALDCLLPLYALAAAGVLVWFLASGRKWNGVIVALVLGKVAYDALFHFLAVRLWQRWQGERGLAGSSLLATLTEPFFFQLLRHLGALLGWIDFFSRRIDWAPQRPHRPPGGVGG